MNNVLRGTRLVAAGIIATCTAIGASVTTATAVSASTAARAGATAHATNAATTGSPATRRPSLAQIAMLEQRAKWAEHAKPSRTSVITGSVVGFDGQPVAGACVTAVGRAGSVSTAAAPDGTFRLTRLAAGSYVLKYGDCTVAGRELTSSSGYLTSWSGGAAARSMAARVQVTAGQVRTVPVMTLKPANLAAAIAARQASFRRTLAVNGRSLSPAAAAKTGEITGKVTGKGKPLAGICVAVTPASVGQGYGAKTTKNGTYTVHNVAPGRYHVAFAPVFECPHRSNWLQQVYKNDNSPFAAFNGRGTVVRVKSGHKTAGISGNLRLGGQISGTVTSKSGAKLRGICILAEASFGRHQSFGYGDQTAANGSYQLHALFPGKYTLHFSIGCGSRGANYAPATHRAVKLHLGQDLTIDEALAPGASISGEVTLGSSSGMPLGGICVDASNASGSVTGFTATRSNGHYRIIGLDGGSFQLQFSPGCRNNGNYTSVSLTAQTTAGQQTTNVDAVLQVAAEITGKITDRHGNPVSGICVYVVGTGAAAGSAGLDTNGSYVVDQLPAGTYQVGFSPGCGNRGSYAPNWYNNQPSENTATPITLTTSETFTADAVMQPGATITGKVTNAAGNGLSGVCVSAATQFDAEIGPASEMQTDTRHGTYRLANLAPGQYLINFGCGLGRKYADQWFPGAPDAASGDLVSALAGKTSGINAVLRPAGNIKGVVTNRAGRPLAGSCVFAVNTKGTLPTPGGLVLVGELSGTDHLAITGADGTYQMSGLAAGRYKVLFAGSCFSPTRYADQWYRSKSSALAATDITVRAGKTTAGIDGRLVLGGTISGRVVNGSGKPLRNICVIAASQSGGAVGAGLTGKTGTYTIPALNSGRYTVEFSPCGNQNLVTVVAHARVSAPHATKGVNATMHPGGSIAGVVTAGSSGPPVSTSCVEVFRGNSAGPVGFGLTGPDGGYLATGLPAGTYQVYFGDPQCLPLFDLAPQWYNNQATQATANSVTVQVGATTGSIDAALQPDGEITGTVSAPSATPLSGACVTAVPLPAGSSLPIVAVTGATGYTLAQLVPGRYKVKFSAGCGAVGYATQWWKQQTSRKAATVIKVGPGQDRSGVSATLSRSS